MSRGCRARRWRDRVESPEQRSGAAAPRKERDQALKATLAVALAAQVARDFLAGAPRRTPSELAALLEVPPPLVEEILEALVRAGLLVRTVTGHHVGYVPGATSTTCA